MKRCPTCDKTFDDNMRFCQADGTPLVEEAPVDPYKTMIARPEDIAAAMPPESPDDVLDLPAESDPAKTMYVSESEIRAEMDARDEQVIDIPPLVEPAPSSFSESTPPPSPFSSDMGSATVPPIPSPFDTPKAETYEPPSPRFAEPEPVAEEPRFNPFENQPASAPIAQAEWMPPPVPDAGWENQQIGQNTPFQPPAPGVGNPSSTLAIISLALGIIGLLTIVPTIVFLLCGILPFFFGLGAIITGFLARSRAKSQPAAYTGGGMATIGLVLGVLDVLAPFGVLILTVVLWGGLTALGLGG